MDDDTLHPIWTVEKEVLLRKWVEDFKIHNLRLPTIAEESDEWDRIFHMRIDKTKKNDQL